MHHISAGIGRRLKELRVERAMSQTYVAENMQQVGYTWTQQTVSEIEAGRRRLLVDEVYLLSAVIGTTLDELLPVA